MTQQNEKFHKQVEALATLVEDWAVEKDRNVKGERP